MDTDHEDRIAELRDRLLDLQEQGQSVQNLADAEKRDLTEEEQEELKRIYTKFGEIEEQIELRQTLKAQADRLSKTLALKAEKQDPLPQNRAPAEDYVPQNHRRQAPRVEILEDPSMRGRWGFRSFGEFASSVRAAVRGSIDPRLVRNAPTTVSTEGVGADGGYAVPPDFRQSIMEKVMGEASLLPRTDQITTGSNSITFPADETTPWQTSGGVLAYWEGENSQLTQSKIALKTKTLRLNKLTALVPVTEELLEDAPTLDGYLRRAVGKKFDFALNLALMRGTGAGQPQGIMNAGCLVTVAKETSQLADTVVAENIFKMWSRLYGPSRANAVWLIHQDVEPTLQTMVVKVLNVAGSENVGGGPVYIPPGGLSGAPYATLMGRPVIPTEACETVGDLGDIVLADLSQYMTAIKSGGVRTDVSMHLWFDYDTLAYRFIFRVGGMPWWNTAIDPRDGSNTRSCFVTLAERA